MKGDIENCWLCRGLILGLLWLRLEGNTRYGPGLFLSENQYTSISMPVFKGWLYLVHDYINVNLAFKVLTVYWRSYRSYRSIHVYAFVPLTLDYETESTMSYYSVWDSIALSKTDIHLNIFIMHNFCNIHWTVYIMLQHCLNSGKQLLDIVKRFIFQRKIIV